jgi:hypothetical protein
MIPQKLKDYWRIADDVEKCHVIKERAIRLNRLHKSMVLANKNVDNYGINRIGKRGGKFTTLQAKSANAADQYIDALEEIKYLIQRL